ncbi:TRAP transporter small permease [Clostridium sp.]|uniref:TRAP transporter small permease n=1 Tax=Clostridium sp. TaxID=1506 RepID=UPI001A4E22F5|nr:TRAP transporter small permease [Clostridium sp.]MBK5236803.1 TRAP transporter small permease [Clostridium sp.]
MQSKTNAPEQINIIDKVYAMLQKIIKYTVAIFLTSMVILVFANVISRYFLNFAIAWTEEVTRFMFIWVVFLSAVLAYVNDEHLKLDILEKKLPKKIGQVVAVICDLIVMYAIYLITAGGKNLALQSWNWLSPAISFSYGIVYLVVPICGGLMLLQTLLKLYYHVKKIVS